MIRVLYSFPEYLGFQGLGTTAWGHVVGLAAQGAAVTVACGGVVRPMPVDVSVVETMRRPIRVSFRLSSRLLPRTYSRFSGPQLLRTYSWHDRRVASMLAKSVGKFDVVHCWPRAAERTLAVARATGVRSVLERPHAHTAHALDIVEQAYADLGIPVDPTDTHLRVTGKLEKEEREYRAADRILCPSQFVQESFLERGFPADTLVVTGRGYDPLQFNAVGRVDSTGPLRVCFVGNGGPRKGLHYALQAWLDSGVGDAGGKFLIAGGWPQSASHRVPGLLPSYRAALEPLLRQESVELLGYVADPASLMRSCDVLVLPSVEEAAAKVTYEARACGCVLVVSDRASGPVRHGIDAMVHAAGDVVELTTHLRALSNDRQLLERLRSESMEVARQQDWNAAARVLMHTYQVLTGNHRGNGTPGTLSISR